MISRKIASAIKCQALNFPIHIQELNNLGHTTIPMDFSKQDPTINDKEYLKRRNYIGEMSKFHQIDKPIEQINYTNQQHALWQRMFTKALPLRQKIMSRQYLKNLNQLMLKMNFNKKIPKINNLSNYLKSKTGFQLKPVSGIINQRQFLNCLAFKVFCSGQFIRHPQCEEFAPEPDVVHQFIGHIPFFANKQIAALSQQIGLLSLGASDQDLQKLGYAYLHFLQFGICKQDNETRAYGAGICGCLTDMKKILSNDFEQVAFDPQNGWRDQFNYVVQQNRYWMVQSFSDALMKIRKLGNSLQKPYRCSYEQQTKSIIVEHL